MTDDELVAAVDADPGMPAMKASLAADTDRTRVHLADGSDPGGWFIPCDGCLQTPEECGLCNACSERLALYRRILTERYGTST